MGSNHMMTFTFPGGARVDGHVNGFEIRTDQPPDATAPSPFTLFLASIGACAGVYLQAFCRRRGIPTDGIRVVQRHRMSDQGLVEAVDLTIELPEDFPEHYRAAALRSADQCTVKRHLEHPPIVTVTSTVIGSREAASVAG